MQPQPPRNSDINSLTPETKNRVLVFLDKCKKAGLNVAIFEAHRTRERQAWLFGQGRTRIQCIAAGLILDWSHPGNIVTWTMDSKHLKGEAVDIVFIDKKGNPSWSGDWDKVIKIGKESGLQSLAPKEMSHLQLPNV